MAVSKINTGRKDRRIIIETWGTIKGAGGGTTGVITNSYTIWADVENKDQRLITDQQQREWPYNFKITVRYEKSRPIDTTKTIAYDGQRMSIISISINREGMRWEYVLKCTGIGKIT